jgi:uncharacterized protein
MKTLIPSDFKTMPWANGLGATTEIFKQPAATDDRFLWRVSLADIPASGPFSIFQNYDRVLAQASGKGMTLRVAGREPVTLAVGGDAYSFAGSAETECDLLDGPVQAFNLVFDPASVRGDVVVLSNAGKRLFENAGDVSGQTLLVYVLAGSAEISGEIVSTGDAGLVESATARVELREGLAFVVVIDE